MVLQHALCEKKVGACCKGMLEVYIHVAALTDIKIHTSVRGAARADATFLFTDIRACCFRCKYEKGLTDITYRECSGSSSCQGCSFGRPWGCTSLRLVVAQYRACQPSPSSWLAPTTCFLLRATLSRHAPACGACSLACGRCKCNECESRFVPAGEAGCLHKGGSCLVCQAHC